MAKHDIVWAVISLERGRAGEPGISDPALGACRREVPDSGL